MTEESFEIPCPHCAAAIDLTGHGSSIPCPECNQEFLLAGHLCAACHTYHEQEAPYCRNCGQPLARLCPKCQARNWPGDDHCRHCGWVLDIFEMMQIHHTQGHRLYTEQRRQEIQQIKEKEEGDSQERMSVYLSHEQARLAKVRQQKRSQKRWEMLIVVSTFLAICLCLFIIIAVYLYQTVFSF